MGSTIADANFLAMSSTVLMLDHFMLDVSVEGADLLPRAPLLLAAANSKRSKYQRTKVPTIRNVLRQLG